MAGERLTKIGNALKKAVGVEGDFKTVISPMIGYNSAIFLGNGSFYIIGIYFLNFLTYVEGLTTKQAGIVVLCAKLCDAITDPAMGIITDRTRSKFGKHRVYILIGIIPAAISYFLMWYSFGISSHFSQTATMIYYIFAYMLFSAVWTLIMVPHTAMLPTLAPEYSLRTQYNAIRTILDAIGSYGSFIISAILFGFVETEEFSPASRNKFLLMGILLALFFSLPLIYTFKATDEPSSVNLNPEPFNARELVSEYRDTFRNKAFRQYFMLSIFNCMATGFIANSSYYFLRNVADHAELNSILVTIAGIAEAAGFPLNYWLSMKYSKQLPARIELPSILIAMGLSFFVNSTTSVPLLLAVYIFYNFGLAGMASVTSNILPDVTDVDEMITGRRREGVVSTFSTFIRKTISGLMATFTGFILSGFGFDQKIPAALQPAKAIRGIRLTYAVLPMIFVSMSIIAAFRYRMTKDDHKLIQKVVEQKKNGKINLTDEEKIRCSQIAGIDFNKMWVGKND